MSTQTALDTEEALAQRQATRVSRLMKEDAQFRDALPREEVSETIARTELSASQVIALAFESYADRPAAGYRATKIITDPATGRRQRQLTEHFETITYSDLWARVTNLACAWREDPATRIEPGDLVGILAFADPDYVAIDLATVYLGGVPVPLQHNASVEQLREIVNETEPRCLATSIKCLPAAVEIIKHAHRPASLVVFNYEPRDDDQADIFNKAIRDLEQAGISIPVQTLEALCATGAGLPTPPMHIPSGDHEATLRTIYYTSGSTGSPKGAMYSESMFKMPWCKMRHQLPVINLLYMPMNHTLGRLNVHMALANGGISYFTASDDLSTFFEDVQKVRPTFLSLVPRMIEMIFQQFQREVDRRLAGSPDRAEIERAVMEEMRETKLGGRILGGSGGSAPLSPELRRFIETCIDYRIREGFGATEIAAFSLNGRVARPAVIDYKLMDVPELGYFTTDKPHPRGELYVKTRTLMMGYYKRPDVTASVFDEQGYYKTGDIMAEIEPDHLVWVDRRNNILKLAQGEFVAIARLESIFVGRDPLIRQIFLYGNSNRSFLLAVVVPNPDMIEPGETEAGLKARLREALRRITEVEGLQPYEVPRDFLVEQEPFSVENGLLAGIGKVLRPALKARYGDRLERLYDEIASQQSNQLRALRDMSGTQPVLATVGQALQVILGLEEIDPEQPHNFRDLGGDSMSALSFSLLLEEIFSVEVPVGVIADSTSDLRRLAAHIEKLQAGDGKRPTFASVHGANADTLQASDLTLDKFLQPATLEQAGSLAPFAGDVHTVLVTGANGFLGRFLCLEWLERAAAVNGRVICIIRGRDNDDARTRLDLVFDSGDAQLSRHYRELAASHLEVLAGDISEPGLGLDEAEWERLAEQVDLIVHPAALVNHVLPYGQLFGPNVVGTAELVHLALSTRVKAFCNISSLAAAGGSAEEDDIRLTCPSRPLESSQYAAGYASSKWAGEVLLREAHARFGLPVTVFRCDMILAHSHYRGQFNQPDMFSRWLASVVMTGMAPNSFYIPSDVAPHYDGLPVDFTASAIATLSERSLEGFHTFHVVNPHDDGISLDSFVDWAIAAGYPIRRLADYDEWLARFETALRALPEKQRQNSSLALMHQLRQPMPALAGASVPASRFEEAVSSYRPGGRGQIPHLSEVFIGKFLEDLRRAELI